MNLLRGAQPSPRHRLAAAMPHQPYVAVAPEFLWKPSHLDIWLNDQYGCCVSAEEAFNKACFTPEIFITDATLLAFCKQHDLLNGADLISVIDLMENNGFQQDSHTYDDGAPTSVDWTNRATLMSAIAHGPVKIAVAADQLQAICENIDPFPANGWFATGFKPDSNLDHCTALAGYGTLAWLAEQLGVTVPTSIDGSAFGYGLFTWGSIGIIDEPSMLAITGEAWLRTPSTIVR